MWDEHERFTGRFVWVCGWSIVMIGAAIALVSLVFKTPAAFLAYVKFLALLGLIGLTDAIMMLGITTIANGLCQGVRSIGTRHAR